MDHGTHLFSGQSRVVFGRPAGEVVRELADEDANRRIHVVTTASLTDGPVVRKMVDALGARVVGVSNDCRAHSPDRDVFSLAQAVRAEDADAIVAIGGGSVIDTTKAAQLVLRHDLPSLDVLPTTRARVRELRVFAVPTTLSAAEFTSLAGITDTAKGIKRVLDHPELYLDVAVLDPEATLTTPRGLLLSTGIRAVDHCVETLCSTGATPISDVMAEEGLRRLTRGLQTIARDPDDLAARLDAQLGAWLAISGLVGGVPVGASHAIGRVLGGALGVPHGQTSCVLLPSVLRWNAGARQERVVAAMAGIDGATAANRVARLIALLEQPSRLRDVGVQRTQFGEIAEKSLLMLAARSTSGNPKPVTTAAQVLEILDLAW